MRRPPISELSVLAIQWYEFENVSVHQCKQLSQCPVLVFTNKSRGIGYSATIDEIKAFFSSIGQTNLRWYRRLTTNNLLHTKHKNLRLSLNQHLSCRLPYYGLIYVSCFRIIFRTCDSSHTSLFIMDW